MFPPNDSISVPICFPPIRKYYGGYEMVYWRLIYSFHEKETFCISGTFNFSISKSMKYCAFKTSRCYHGLKSQYQNENLEFKCSGDSPLLPKSLIFNYQNGFQKLWKIVVFESSFLWFQRLPDDATGLKLNTKMIT